MRKRVIILLLAIAMAISVLVSCKQKEASEKPTSLASMSIVVAPGYEDSAQKMAVSMESCGISMQIEAEVPDSGMYRPVLIGPLNIQNAQDEVLKLREKDYTIQFLRDYILIAGGSAEAVQEAVEVFTAEYTEYFCTYGDFPYGDEYSRTSIGSYEGARTKRILVDNVSVHKYVLATKGGAMTDAAVLLQTVLNNMAAIELPIVDVASLRDTDYAIVFGSGNDERTAPLVNQLNEKEGWIRQD